MLARIDNPDRLALYMRHKGLNCQTLADAVVDAQRGTPRSKVVPCSRPLISHLRSGKRSSTDPDRAKLIELVLGVPTGELFKYTPTVSTRGVR